MSFKIHLRSHSRRCFPQTYLWCCWITFQVPHIIYPAGGSGRKRRLYQLDAISDSESAFARRAAVMITTVQSVSQSVGEEPKFWQFSGCCSCKNLRLEGHWKLCQEARSRTWTYTYLHYPISHPLMGQVLRCCFREFLVAGWLLP